MKKIVTTALIMLSATTLFADEQRAINMGLKVGTLGYGLDISTPLSNSVSARFNLNGFTYSDNQESDGNNFEGTLDLMTAGVLLDYYPFRTNFRLSSGLYYNGSKFSGKAVPTATTTIDIDGTEYTTDDINSLNSDISLNSFAPYIGMGWGNDAHDAGWGFTFDIGAMYIGTPQIDLNADVKNVALATQINNSIIQEEQNVQNDLNAFKFYPVVMIGANYTF